MNRADVMYLLATTMTGVFVGIGLNAAGATAVTAAGCGIGVAWGLIGRDWFRKRP